MGTGSHRFADNGHPKVKERKISLVKEGLFFCFKVLEMFVSVSLMVFKVMLRSRIRGGNILEPDPNIFIRMGNTF